MATRTAAAWKPEPTEKRRRLLPSWKKMSRGLNRLRNLVERPAFALRTIFVIIIPDRPGGATKARSATQNFQGVLPCLTVSEVPTP